MGEGRNVHTFTTRESYAEMYCYYITKRDTINQTVTAVKKTWSEIVKNNEVITCIYYTCVRQSSVEREPYPFCRHHTMANKDWTKHICFVRISSYESHLYLYIDTFYRLIYRIMYSMSNVQD